MWLRSVIHVDSVYSVFSCDNFFMLLNSFVSLMHKPTLGDLFSLLSVLIGIDCSQLWYFKGDPEKDFLIWQTRRTPIAALFQ